MGILNRLQAYGNWLLEDPAGFAVYIVCFCVCVLGTLILHEVAHGYAALKCGDPTAKLLGRLSLDPRAHLDPIGTACLVLLGFGWAKPVPVNPYNFRNKRRDDLLVSVAGIAVNLTLFLVTLFAAVMLNGLLWRSEVINFYGARDLLSQGGAGYNALLYGKLGANDELMRAPWLQYVQRFLLMFSTLNLSIGIFNLLPIPPLDGFHLLNDIVLKGKLTLDGRMFRIAQAALLLLCFTGVLSGVLTAVIEAVNNAVLSLFMMIAGIA